MGRRTTGERLTREKERWVRELSKWGGQNRVTVRLLDLAGDREFARKECSFRESVILRNGLVVDAAARFFGLNSSSADDRDILLCLLARATFGDDPMRKRGQRRSGRVWDRRRLWTLAKLYFAHKRENPRLSKGKIAELIRKHWAFKNDDPEQIRQKLSAAIREFSAPKFRELLEKPSV